MSTMDDNIAKQQRMQEIECILDGYGKLTAEDVREWLSFVGEPYSWLAAELRCAESTVKNWLSTTKEIPDKRQESLRKIMKRRLSLHHLYREMEEADSTGGASIDDVEDRLINPEPEGDVTYKIPRRLYELLSYIGKRRFKSPQQLINEVLYGWVSKNIRFYEPKITTIYISSIQGKRISIDEYKRFVLELLETIQTQKKEINAQISSIENTFEEMMNLAERHNNSSWGEHIKSLRNSVRNQIQQFERDEKILKSFEEILNLFSTFNESIEKTKRTIDKHKMS